MMPVWMKDAWLNAALRGEAFTPPAAHYLALFSSDPMDGGREISAEGYVRQAVAFAAPREGVCKSAAEVSFPWAPVAWGGVSHYGIFDAPAGGRLLATGKFRQAKFVGKNDLFRVPKGEIVERFGPEGA